MVACCCAISVSLHAQDRSPRVLVLGDSLSTAYGLAPEQGWVALLAEQFDPHAVIINASISGETTEGGRQRLPPLLSEYKPQVVIIELGGNDGLRGYPLASIRTTLNNMIILSRKSGAEVLFVGMRIPPNYGRRYSQGFADIYSSLADEHALTLIPFLLEGIAGNTSLMQSDGIHPNVSAQKTMATRVGKYLQPILDELVTLRPTASRLE